MTIFETLISWACAPLLGWGWSVENRLTTLSTKLDSLQAVASKTDQRVEKIYDHLLGDRTASRADSKSQEDSRSDGRARVSDAGLSRVEDR